MHDEIKHIVVLQKELYILMVIKLSDDNEMCMINWKIEFFVLHGYEYPYNVQKANVWILTAVS